MTQAERLYLDANATSPPLPQVVAAANRAMAEFWGNPSSQHMEGRLARKTLTEATASVAGLLDVPESWLTWTSGGTEAANMWLAGILPSATESRRTILTTAGEHPATRRPLEMAANAGWIDLVYLPTDMLGVINLDDTRELLADLSHEHILCAMVIAAHNETGGCQNLRDMSALFNEYDIRLFCDGVQWTGKKSISLSSDDVTGWSVSFHKFGGPKGVGLLAARPGVLEKSLIAGGPQQKKRRAGTENLIGIAGAAVAASLAREHLADRTENWAGVRDQLTRAIIDTWPDAQFFHDERDGLPQTILVRFPGWRGEEMVQRLDLEGVAASTGSACSSGSTSASEAMLALGHSRDAALELVRFSLPIQINAGAAQTLGRTLKLIRG